MDEDEEEEEEEWIEEDFVPADPPRAEPSPEERKHALGVVCPICQKALGAGVNNEMLNAHIDKCLKRASGAPASPRAKAQQVRPSRAGGKTSGSDAFARMMSGRRG